MDEAMRRALRATAHLEDTEARQVPVARIAESAQIRIDEVRLIMAEAQRNGYAFYFNEVQGTTLSTGPAGWTVTGAGRVALGDE